jgi:hypothetical protein
MPNAGLDPYECDCRWLEQAANDPTVPIGFDPKVNEYYLKTGTPGGVEAHYVIRFCPNCGGDAPVSHRGNMSEVVTPEERVRLQKSWSNLRTRDDVVRAWGQPDEQIRNGYSETEPHRTNAASRTVTFDLMRYNNLSAIAVVDVILCAGDRVMFMYHGKAKQT